MRGNGDTLPKGFRGPCVVYSTGGIHGNCITGACVRWRSTGAAMVGTGLTLKGWGGYSRCKDHCLLLLYKQVLAVGGNKFCVPVGAGQPCKTGNGCWILGIRRQWMGCHTLAELEQQLCWFTEVVIPNHLPVYGMGRSGKTREAEYYL